MRVAPFFYYKCGVIGRRDREFREVKDDWDD